MSADEHVTKERTISGSAIAIALTAFALVMAYFAFGMPGMDHGSSTAPPVGYDAVNPDTFAARMRNGDPFVVNVHVPFDGEIEGTDDHIPFDRIAASSALPTALASEILLYCRTGAMAADAARALVERGYTNVTVLRGGMDAWEASGRPIRGTT